MDPVQFIWEVVQAVSALVMAVALPLFVFWLIARSSKKRRSRQVPPNTGNRPASRSGSARDS